MTIILYFKNVWRPFYTSTALPAPLPKINNQDILLKTDSTVA